LRCGVLRRFRAIPPDQDRSTIMSQPSRSIDSSTLLVRDAHGEYRLATSEEVLHAARRAVSHRVRRGAALSSPQVVRDFLRIKLGTLEHEVFVTLLLDSQHRVIEYAELFRGTLAQTSVYPREVVKIALTHNAAAMIFAHNHPSGVPEPSRADELLTQTLKQALSLVDIRVLDHFVVAGSDIVSFAERGLL
jgi:DNA repair protein RadC